MANLARKLIKKSPPIAPSLIRTIATPLPNTIPQSDFTSKNPSQIPLLNPTQNVKSPSGTNPFERYCYPHSFQSVFCLNPVSTLGFSLIKEDAEHNGTSDDARTLWADSVKKKRKKKMNKHKYKKRRKRLRRKARRSS